MVSWFLGPHDGSPPLSELLEYRFAASASLSELLSEQTSLSKIAVLHLMR